ncbi:MAG: hypothetical protein AB1352_03910 [Patescibacteria group bacterium]
MNITALFNPYPTPLPASTVRILLAVVVGGCVMSVGLYVVARYRRHDPPLKRFLMKFVQWCTVSTALATLLLFFRQQRAYVLSMAVIAYASVGGCIAWLVYLTIKGTRRLAHDQRAWREQEERKKYL